MLVVVLNDWVTETKETPWASNVSTSFAKSASERGQPIDLIDDDHIDPSRLNIDEQLLQRRPIHRPAGKAAVVVTIPNQSPALARLALDVGVACFPLGVEGIEILLEPVVGRDARIDGATQAASGRLILHGGASPADAPFVSETAVLFLRSVRTSAAEVFPNEGRRSDDHSRWSRSSPLRSATGCRRSGHSRRSLPSRS
jgi:hypothetical protein